MLTLVYDFEYTVFLLAKGTWELKTDRATLVYPHFELVVQWERFYVRDFLLRRRPAQLLTLYR